MAKKRIILDSENFTNLIKGEVIIVDDIEIALSDIIYENMVKIIEDAMWD